MDAVLGIDIGKAKFHVTLLFSDGTRRRKACANSPAGCTRAARLAGSPSCRPCARLPRSDRRLRRAARHRPWWMPGIW